MTLLRSRTITTTGLVLLAMAVGSVAACGKDKPPTIAGASSTTSMGTTTNGGPSDSLDPTSTSVTTTTGSTPTASGLPPASDADPRSAEERLIIERYQAFWDARAAANAEPPNPDSPQLRDLATGSQLLNVIEETTQRKKDGLALRPAQPSKAEHRAAIRSLSGDTAELNDCSINDGVVYRPSTGDVVDDSVVTRNATATMRKIDGAWRLESASVIQTWKGVAGCALAET